MNERRFRRLFPNASEATAAANCELLPAKSREQAPALEREVSREKEGTARTSVSIRCVRKRLLDPDNNVGSVKDLLDGLVLCTAIPDDSEKHIDLQVTQELVKRGEEPYTVIEIQQL